MAQSLLHVGTSGWSYPHWRGFFYPPKLSQKAWFKFYAAQFDTAEINATFYRVPTRASVCAWREAAPEGFQFAWKASRYITEAKKLRDAEGPLERIYAPMAELGPKTGPTLFQLPPQLGLDLERLRTFLQLLPAGGRQAIEFRHPSWYGESGLRASLRARCRALSLRPPRRAGAMGSYGQLRLYSRTRARRNLRGIL
jgi:uncharacterized protein YecE (DUF72 family)